MSLRDREPVPTQPAGRRYRIDEILDELDDDEGDALRGWLADLRFSPESIRKELIAEGIPISTNAIASYRFSVLGLGERSR